MLELLLAVLSASAATGMRISIPLLMIGLLYGGSLWSHVPLLSHVSPAILLGVLVSWSCVELVASKSLLGQRVLQMVQVCLSPIVGAIVGITVAQATGVTGWQAGLLGSLAGVFALVLQLVQAGWFYRLRGLPLWAVLMQDMLCITLVLLAFDAPKQGGLIALLLLWLAIRSSSAWRNWYRQQARPGSHRNPRRYMQEPD